MITKVKCPTCQKSIIWSKDNRYRPFCSDRCQLIDLGEWASENRVINGSHEKLKWRKLPEDDT